MIKNLLLLVAISSTFAIADDMPEPGLATPAYTPPIYIPTPAYAPPVYTPAPTYNMYVTIQPSPVRYRQLRQQVMYAPPVTYDDRYPMVTNRLGYDNYGGRFLRQR